MNELRVKALLGLLLREEEEVTLDDIKVEYDEVLSVDGIEYLVLTEEEADKRVTEYIKDSIWSFHPDFLETYTGIDRKVFIPLTELCESGNEAISLLVQGTCGMDSVISGAIEWDGRGHFLNSYDGSEEEICVDGTWFCIYRY